MGAADSVTKNGDNGLNESLSALVCLAYEHPEAVWGNTVPFCVANVDQDEDTTYQLIGFREACKQKDYKIQGYLSSQYVSSFLAAHGAKLKNAQFRDVDLIPCSELGLEDNRQIDWLHTYIPTVVGGVVSGALYCFRKVKKLKEVFKIAAFLTGVGGLAVSAFWILLDMHAEHLKEEARHERIQNLISGKTTAEKK